MSHDATPPGTGRKLALVVLGLSALIAAMLCAFALPALHSGPHHVPIGVTGPREATEAIQGNVDGPAWDVRLYKTSDAVETAVRNKDITGGLAVTAHGVDVYTATAGGPSATSALTALGNGVAEQNRTRATVHDLVPFTDEDPRGAGLTAALMPMIFGGIFPALILGGVFPGHRGLPELRAAILEGLTALGVILGMTAMSTTLLGLQAFLGMGGFALGGALMMLLGNPLSGLATGPHWLPDGWATIGQLLPPGASGSLLRTNAFFDGTGACFPALVLTAWGVLGVTCVLLADRRGNRLSASLSDATDTTGAPDVPRPAFVSP